MSYKSATKENDEEIFAFLRKHPLSSSKEIFDAVSDYKAYSTLKRTLTTLIKNKLLISVGRGKSTKYAISPFYELLYHIDTNEYFKAEIDERTIKDAFNHDLINNIISATEIFTEDELEELQSLQQQFLKNISQLPATVFNKEMERLAIDLSWKSSQIEGNTYSLLETERLLKDHETAKGKSKDEATMLLNHKEAINFIVAHPDYVIPLKVAAIEDIHSLLIKDLDVERNIRRARVGISGTNYKPLDNEYQIREALQQACDLLNAKRNVFEKALIILILISYIQPFADGNKRTARILSNALLIADNHCPISFRTVDAIEYKKAMLVFYEQNNLSAFKKIFIDQFKFAVNTYF